MEIVATEKQTFEKRMQKFESFAKQINTLCRQNQINDNWLVNKQVSEPLKILYITLQTYRICL